MGDSAPSSPHPRGVFSLMVAAFPDYPALSDQLDHIVSTCERAYRLDDFVRRLREAVEASPSLRVALGLKMAAELAALSPPPIVLTEGDKPTPG
jgi:hypothetical protein